jgi:hypothetical protein
MSLFPILNKGLAAPLAFSALAVAMAGCGVLVREPDSLIERFELKEENSYQHSIMREDMHDMWASLKNIVLTDGDDATDSQKQRMIIGELNSISHLAELLEAENSIYNYKFTAPYMSSFLHDVDMAIQYASKEPPDFTPSTNLINSCQFCHINN